jgi:hypothetical protein
LHLSVVPSTASASLTNRFESLPSSTNSDDLYIQIDITQAQLLLTASTHNSSAAQGTTAASKAGKGAHVPNSSSKAHQQHPLGLSPPSTPNKSTQDLSSHGMQSADGSSTAGNSSGSNRADGAVTFGRPLPARQLEAVLLSHSPRMLVIDNFFSPGGELRYAVCELPSESLELPLGPQTTAGLHAQAWLTHRGFA